MKKQLLFLLFVFAGTMLHAQTNVYVNAGANGGNNGTSWSDAFTSLEAALNVANAGSSTYNIYVAGGTYKPSNVHSGTARDAFFGISRGGINIYGGFDAASGNRNLLANPTILSGDIGVVADDTDNAYHILVVAGLQNNADSVVVDGFAITGSKADGNDLLNFNGADIGQYQGGGFFALNNANDGKIMLRNCTFSQNFGTYGAGAFLEYTAATFDKCTFSNNNTVQSGAGIAAVSNAAIKVVDCQFKDNTTGTSGAAIFVEYDASANIEKSIFDHNQSQFSAGAIQTNGGVFILRSSTFSNNSAQQMAGAIFTMQLQAGSVISGCKFLQNTALVAGAVSFAATSAANITDCIFEGNTAATNGGAIISSFDNGLTFTNNFFVNNSATAGMGGAYSSSAWQSGSFNNCVFAGNAAAQGGAVAISNASGGSFNLCTFSNNSASADGQTVYLPDGVGAFSNSIIWKDGNYTGGDNVNIPSSGATLTLAYNLIQQASVGGKALPDTEGNINANPMFVNAANVKGADGIYGTADDGLYLMAGSPAINAGDNALVPVGSTTDITGAQRTSQSSVDIGAYEASFSPPVITVQPVSVTACLGGTATFSVTATGANSYRWQVVSGANYNDLENVYPYAGTSTATLTITNVTTSVSCVCKVTNANGSTQSEIVTLNITDVSTNLTKTDIKCNGAANGSASVAPTGGTAPYTYSWKSVATNIVIDTAARVDSLAVGAYQVIITDSMGCSKTESFSIAEPTAISVNITKTDVTTCNTDASGAATATVLGGTAPYTYSWTSVERSAVVSTTSSVTNVLGGKYMLTVTDANGCIKLDSVEIARPAAFEVVAEQTNVTDFTSPDGSAKVTVSGANAPYTYLWTKGSITVGTGSAITNVTGGKYTCTITDANGCTYVQNFILTTPIVRLVYVNQAAASGGDGTSWTNAFQTLKDALAFSNQTLTVDEIRVAEGTYYPTGVQTSTDRLEMFTITRGGIKLLGGYNATTGQRDVINNATILSGNIGDVNNVNDNSVRVMVIAGVASGADSTKVDGFTIQDAVGNTNLPLSSQNIILVNNRSVYINDGLALNLTNNANPITISNCILKDNNSTISSGTIYSTDTNLYLENCIFKDNRTQNGSAFFSILSDLHLTNCKITNNHSEEFGILYFWSYLGNKLTLKNTIFENNTTNTAGAALYVEQATLEVENCSFENNVSAIGNGVINVSNGDATFKKTSFISNQANRGGAIYFAGDVNNILKVDQSFFSSNSAKRGGGAIFVHVGKAEISNSLFNGNRSDNIDIGQAILSNGNILNLNNLTFYNNGRNDAANIVFAGSAPLKVTNSIFWNNTAINNLGGGTYNVTYSNLQQASGIFAGTGNINADPLFVNPSNPSGADGIWGTSDDGLRLQNCSPSANTGWNEGIANDAKDLFGNARVQDGRADMGAYERVSAVQAQLITSGSTESTNLKPANGTATYVDPCGRLIATVGRTGVSSVRLVLTLSMAIITETDLQNLFSSIAVAARVSEARVQIAAVQPGSSRSVEAAPLSNSTGNTNTNLVTLYYTQADFDDYNARYPGAIPLPQNSGETAALANLVIYNYEGESSDGSLLPTTYPSATPNKLAVNSCNYNATLGVWEVTFNTTTLGGFFFGTQATTLPLSLLSFDGKTTNGGNQLVWKTAKESNLTNYILERSSDGKDFAELAKVKPKNGEEQQYVYIDRALQNGTLYYRLKITENDGKVSYSDVVALKGLSEVKNFLSPNPATNFVHIHIGDNSVINTDAIIVNVAGQTVKKLHITAATQEVDISGLAKGSYIVRLANGENLKLIKH